MNIENRVERGADIPAHGPVIGRQQSVDRGSQHIGAPDLPGTQQVRPPETVVLRRTRPERHTLSADSSAPTVIIAPTRNTRTSETELGSDADGSESWKPTAAELQTDAGWERLVREVGPRLLRSSYAITRDRGKAQDAVQEGLLRAWIKLGTLRDEGSLTGWVATICTRTAINLYRRESGPRNNEVLVDDMPAVYAHYDDVTGIETGGTNGEGQNGAVESLSNGHDRTADADMLREKLRDVNLPPDTADAVALKDGLNMSYADISSATGMDLRTIVGHLHLGRMVLREMAAADDPDHVFGTVATGDYVNSHETRRTSAHVDIEEGFRRVLVDLDTPSEQAEAVLLRDKYGLSYKEIAEVQGGIALGTVMSRIYRGRTAAYDLLGKEAVEKVFGDETVAKWVDSREELGETNSMNGAAPEGRWADIVEKGRQARSEQAILASLAAASLSDIVLDVVVQKGVHGITTGEAAGNLGIFHSTAIGRINVARDAVRGTTEEQILDKILKGDVEGLSLLPPRDVQPPSTGQIQQARERLLAAEVAPDQVEILIARFVEKESMTEIASRLHKNYFTVAGTVRHGRDAIAQRFGADVLDDLERGKIDKVMTLPVTIPQRPEVDESTIKAAEEKLLAAGLTPYQAGIVIDRGLRGLSIKDIATQREKSHVTVKSVYYQTKERIKTLLGEDAVAEFTAGEVNYHRRPFANASTVTPGYEVGATATRDKLLAANFRLDHADAAAMRYVEGLPIPVIAERMGIPPERARIIIGSVTKRIHSVFGPGEIQKIRRGDWEHTESA